MRKESLNDFQFTRRVFKPWVSEDVPVPLVDADLMEELGDIGREDELEDPEKQYNRRDVIR